MTPGPPAMPPDPLHADSLRAGRRAGKGGRPSRFNEALAVELVCLIDEGLTRKAAAARVGIGERTLHDWQARARRGHPALQHWLEVTVHGSRVTNVQKRVEPQKPSSGASVDPTEARNRFIETAATLAIGEDRLAVAIDHRSHNPNGPKSWTPSRPRPGPSWTARRPSYPPMCSPPSLRTDRERLVGMNRNAGKRPEGASPQSSGPYVPPHDTFATPGPSQRRSRMTVSERGSPFMSSSWA